MLETDHRNLVWIEKSEVPKIIRWRVFLQSFVFLLRHIPQTQNKLADYKSRFDLPDINSDPAALLSALLFLLDEDSSTSSELATLFALAQDETELPSHYQKAAQTFSPDELCSQIHGGRMVHHGVRKTWLALNKHFPGHRIPIRLVEDFVSRCAICQKHRLGMQDAQMPVYRTLKPDSKRKSVGVDTLTITPVDKFGNKYLTVIVVHSTKLVDFYPSASKDALSTAVALFQFFATYGVYDDIISFPGSDLMSEVVEHLTK